MALLSEDQIERAAKEYCRLAGMDPLKMVQAPSPVSEDGAVYDVYMQHEQWRQVASQIRHHDIIKASIQAATSVPGPTNHSAVR